MLTSVLNTQIFNKFELYCHCICLFRRQKQVKDSGDIIKMLFYIVYGHVQNKSVIKIHCKKTMSIFSSNELFTEPFNNYYFYYFQPSTSLLRTDVFTKPNSSIRSLSQPCKIYSAAHGLEICKFVSFLVYMFCLVFRMGRHKK